MSLQEVFDNQKKYRDITEKRATSYENINRALGIVKDFIIRKNHIIYGGMAIDLALKMAGHAGIYDSDALPDYDFMSPHHYDDSNELAIILHKAGLPNVSGINAIHLTSRRVRVNFVSVADLTYIPQNIYDMIPTLPVTIPEYRGLRIVHPNFQRLDMHRAFSTPYEKPPGEVVIQRGRKDIKRFKMLDEMYPIVAPSAGAKKGGAEGDKAAKPETREIKINKKYLQGAALGGLAAYGILWRISSIVTQILEREGLGDVIADKTAEILPIECRIAHGDLVMNWPPPIAGAPATPRINIIADSPEQIRDLVLSESGADESKGVRYFNCFLDDLRPRTIIVRDAGGLKFEIYDNYTRRLPVFNLMKIIEFWKKLDPEYQVEAVHTSEIWIAQPQYLLLYFLLKSFESGEQHREFYLLLYKSLARMIECAELLTTVKGWSEAAYPMIPFFISPNVYGLTNWSPQYIYMALDQLYKINDLPNPIANLRPTFGFYPETSTAWDKFDPGASKLFWINGLEINEADFAKPNFDLEHPYLITGVKKGPVETKKSKKSEESEKPENPKKLKKLKKSEASKK
jgi:Poly(A) polymerase catalytic subunit